MNTRVLIADDEPLSRANMRALLAQLCSWQIVAEAGHGREAVEFLEHHPADIAFLDIRMPGMSGIECATRLASLENPPQVVFTTAYEQYALEAFEQAALDYLLKPISDERLKHTIERFNRFQSGSLQPENRIVVRSVGKYELVNLEEVKWVRSAGNYIELHLQDRTLLHRTSLAQFAEGLQTGMFQRVHRTAIVRLSEIRTVHVNRSGNFRLELHCGQSVPVSQRYREQVQQQLGIGD